MAVALLLAVLVLAGRGGADDADDFCSAYQAAFAEMLQESGPVNGTPDPDAVVRLLARMDVERLEPATPPDLRDAVGRLADGLPKLRKDLEDLPAGTSAITLVSPQMITDATTLGDAYGKRCG
jgi:hypothetical protein